MLKSLEKLINSDLNLNKELLLQTTKELVIQNNPRYDEILNNIDNKLDSNLRYKKLMSYTNGNLITNDTSLEMKTLIAKACNVAYGEDLTEKDIAFASSNEKSGFYDVKIDKTREHEKHKYGLLNYHHEKSSDHSTRTINAKKILDTISIIKGHYKELNQLSEVDKAKMGAALENMTALQYAIKRNKTSAIKGLVEEGADPKGAKVNSNIIDQALKDAIENDNIQTIVNIIKCYPDFKENGSYLSYAIEQNKPEVAAHMIDKGFKPQENFLESLSSLTDAYGGFGLEPEEIANKIGGKVLEEYNKLKVFKQAKEVVKNNPNHAKLTQDIRNAKGKIPKKSSGIEI